VPVMLNFCLLYLSQAQLEAARRAEVRLAPEKSAKPEKDASTQQVNPHLPPVACIGSLPFISFVAGRKAFIRARRLGSHR
jgi:hypothetical protein